MKSYYTIMKKSTLFSNIADNEFESALSCLKAHKKKYIKGQVIRPPEIAVTEVGLIVEGAIHMTKIDVNGNRLMLAELSKGRTFGESLVTTGDSNSPISIVSATQTTVVFVPFTNSPDSQQASCKYYAQLYKNIVTLLAEKNMLLQIKNDILSQKTTQEKLLLYFEYESKTAQSKTFHINFNRQELADFLALNPSALSRELGKMQTKGMLTFKKNKFTLR